MTRLKNIMRWLTPLGLIERHRRRFQTGRLNLPKTDAAFEAAAACRYDLWPPALRNAPSPWTLVDVGANEGEFTRAAAGLAKLKAVHAFEPQPGCQEGLRSVLKEVPEGHLHAVAVGAVAGDIEFYCTSNSKMASVLAPASTVGEDYEAEDFKVTRRVKVPMKRLDDVIPSGTQVGLLKIDVQGYELAVLEGAAETLRSTTALLMEVNYVPHYEGGAAFDAIHEAVRRHGFRTYGISAPYGGKDGPLWADAMFVRDDS